MKLSLTTIKNFIFQWPKTRCPSSNLNPRHVNAAIQPHVASRISATKNSKKLSAVNGRAQLNTGHGRRHLGNFWFVNPIFK